MKDEGRRMKGCSARQISGMNFARGKIHALVSLFASMAARSALPSIFRQRFFSGAVLSVASVGIEDEDVTVIKRDFDRFAGFGALVEQVETRFPIVVWSPLANRLPGRLDGLEGFRRCNKRPVPLYSPLYSLSRV